MSRLTDRMAAWRTAASKPRAAAFAMASANATIWIDGQRARALPAGSSESLKTAGDVAAALHAIETLAPRAQPLPLRGLRVVVGAPFARYFALPWQAVPKPQDWVPFARVQALQTGVGSEAWRYAVADDAWGRGRLAVAMPEALCAGIERLCKTRRLRVLGIEPAYTFALQKHMRRIRDGAIAIVGLETSGDDAALAHIGVRERGGWRSFITLPVTGALDDVLRDAFALSGGAYPERRYVIGPDDPGRWTEDAAQLEWLRAPWDAGP